MLTREAVAAELLPPRRVTLAARALAALEAAHPGCPAQPAIWPPNWPSRPATGPGRRAADRVRPVGAGPGRARHRDRYAAPRRRAAHRPDQRAEAETLLVEGLALAGRVDEAMLVGDRLIAQRRRAAQPPAGGRRCT